jgi:UDP-N-acetylmuramate dehydrogenase
MITQVISASDLKKVIRGVVKDNEPMSMHTTYGVGGPADVYVEPADGDDLAVLLEWLRSHDLPWFVFGGGANLLVADKGIRGVVIHMGKAFSRLNVSGDRLNAGAGAVLAKVILAAAEAGLSGLEFATAVPGSVGGAIVMNGGTHLGRVGGCVEYVNVVTDEGKHLIMTQEDLQFDYRWSVLQTDKTKIVTDVTFQLKPSSKADVMRIVEQLRQRRAVTQPTLGRSAGCMFKNPPGDKTSGWLIEDAGLKGARIGDALVSDRHANFILNVGNATAKDIRQLAEDVRETIIEKFDIELEFEVRVVGDW